MASRRFAVSLLAVLPLLGGCSNREAAVNKEPHPGTSTAAVTKNVQQIVVRTGVDLRFHPSTLVVHRGMVRIVLENVTGPAGGAPHNLQVTGLPGVAVPLTTAGQVQAVTFMAPAPGRYEFVCTIHRAQGQTGVLIVKPGQANT